MIVALLAATTVGTAHANDSKTILVRVDQLTCECCAGKIKDRLAPLCKEYGVDMPKKTISCRYEDPVTAKKITSTIQKLGFDTQIISN